MHFPHIADRIAYNSTTGCDFMKSGPDESGATADILLAKPRTPKL
jgi:hypothetical protein